MKSERSGGGAMMMIRRRKLSVSVLSWSRFIWFTILILLTFSSFIIYVRRFSAISSLRLLSRQSDGNDDVDEVDHNQKLFSTTTWPNLAMEATISSETETPRVTSTITTTTTTTDPTTTTTVTILHTVNFPDQIMFFLNYPPSFPLLTSNDDIDCLYSSLSNSTTPSSTLHLRPIQIHHDNSRKQLVVRCPLQPQVDGGDDGGGNFTSTSLLLKKNYLSHQNQQQLRILVPPPHHLSYRWDKLAYESYLDSNDNTTVVFAKGFNLLRYKLYNSSRFTCIFTTTTTKPGGLFHRSEVISIGQEIIRCKTPPSLLQNHHNFKVSVRLTGRTTLPSITTPIHLHNNTTSFPKHEMCVCTMVRNQARFLKEWITYHTHIGITRYFIYDNNSDDDTLNIITSLSSHYNISLHNWPWIKSQEAGFSHCLITQAQHNCKWVGFIDVDEFIHFPNPIPLPSHTPTPPLHTILHQHSSLNIGEIRTFCYTFGPSGHKTLPSKTPVTLAYTCRVRSHERHKSIVRPEAVSSDLLNAVHHFKLRPGYESVTVDRPVMVINHYKYQVWEVFKEKFYRRVATYVSDWGDEVNTGSKDRAPGLGTKAVEPKDWAMRFCQVNDTGLRDVVLKWNTDSFLF